MGTLWLPALALHTNHIASTRETMSRVVVRGSGIEATMADGLALIGGSLGEAEVSLSLATGVYMGFLPGAEWTFHLVTFDGLFGLPVDIRWRNLEGRLALVHLSGHFADGIDKLDTVPESAGGYSREWLSLSGGAHLLPLPGGGELYPYAEIRYIYHIVDGAPALGGAVGVNLDWHRPVGAYLGAHVSGQSEQDWWPTLAGEVGVQLSGARTLRIGLSGYVGENDAGKFAGQPERYLGLSVSFAPLLPAVRL
ncbi:MAG: hypothetical protein P8R54_12765 [Myxococcota bacterium]|nr:hypothetical protein [Myxococcota bacterium]